MALEVDYYALDVGFDIGSVNQFEEVEMRIVETRKSDSKY